MCGLIWTIQVVHYPIFDRIAADGFAEFSKVHAGRISAVLAVPWGLEVLTTLALVVSTPPGVAGWLPWSGLILTVGIIAITAVVSAPLHSRLGNGFDAGSAPGARGDELVPHGPLERARAFLPSSRVAVLRDPRLTLHLTRRDDARHRAGSVDDLLGSLYPSEPTAELTERVLAAIGADRRRRRAGRSPRQLECGRRPPDHLRRRTARRRRGTAANARRLPRGPPHRRCLDGPRPPLLPVEF